MLESMAEVADGGPWRVDMLAASCAIKTGEGAPYPGDHLANVGNRFTAAWIATMSPAVAAPLVAWMRNTARYLHFERGAVSSPENGREFFEGKYGGALEFARRVLGEHTEEPS